MSRRIILAGLMCYGAWKLFLRTAVTGYNLEYGIGGVQYIGYDDEHLIFDIGVRITNPLPFDTFIYSTKLNVHFNGGLLTRINETINRRIHGKSTQVVPIRFFVKKDFWQDTFLDFIASGNYANWLINIRGIITIDNLKDFPLNIDLTLEDFLKSYADRR